MTPDQEREESTRFARGLLIGLVAAALVWLGLAAAGLAATRWLL